MKYKIANIKNHVVKLRDFLLDIIFPIECLGCEKEKNWLCEDCFKKLEYNHNQYCLNCKTANNFGEICNNCKNNFDIEGILIAGNYQDKLLSKLIKTFKYHFIKNLSQPLGKFLSQFLFLQITKENSFKKPNIFSDFKNVLIIPVPLHKKRRSWRGFNQSEELAKIIAEKFDVKTSTNLKRIKYKKPQMRLKKSQRKKNIKNCYIWEGDDLNEKNILLIDDVTTTGSTLNECAKILKENGANEVWGLVVANG